MGSDPQPLTSIEIKKKEQAYKDAHDIEIDKRIAKDLVGAERTQGPGFSKLEVLSKLDTESGKVPGWHRDYLIIHETEISEQVAILAVDSKFGSA